MNRKNILLFLSGFFALQVTAQLTPAINQLDEKGRKTGYWRTYLSERLIPTDSSNSYFIGYQFYDAGKLPFDLFPQFKQDSLFELKLSSSKPEEGFPVLLSQVVEWHYKNPKSGADSYTRAEFSNGFPVRIFEGFFESTDTMAFYNFDFNKTYKNTPGTFYRESHNRRYSSRKTKNGFELSHCGRFKKTKKAWFRKSHSKWRFKKVKE